VSIDTSATDPLQLKIFLFLLALIYVHLIGNGLVSILLDSDLIFAPLLEFLFVGTIFIGVGGIGGLAFLEGQFGSFNGFISFLIIYMTVDKSATDLQFEIFLFFLTFIYVNMFG